MRASSSLMRCCSSGSVEALSWSANSKNRRFSASFDSSPVSISSTRTRFALVRWIFAKALTRLARRDFFNGRHGSIVRFHAPLCTNLPKLRDQRKQHRVAAEGFFWQRQRDRLPRHRRRSVSNGRLGLHHRGGRPLQQSRLLVCRRARGRDVCSSRQPARRRPGVAPPAICLAFSLRPSRLSGESAVRN